MCNTWTVPAPKGAAEIYNRAEGLKSGISGLPFTPSRAARPLLPIADVGLQMAKMRGRRPGFPGPGVRLAAVALLGLAGCPAGGEQARLEDP